MSNWEYTGPRAAYDCECGGCDLAGQQGRTCDCAGPICSQCGMCEGEHCWHGLEEEQRTGVHDFKDAEWICNEIMRRKKEYYSH